MKKAILAALLLLFLGLNFTNAYAHILISDSTGYDAGYVRDFWGVSFIFGQGYVKSATIDLSPTEGKFDFDGSPFLVEMVAGNEPIIGIKNGLDSSDIIYPKANGSPIGNLSSLTFTFADGAFSSGDWFRFSADVDGAGEAVTSSGGVFGSLDAIFSVEMSTGDIYQVPFLSIDNNRSIAPINMDQGVAKPSVSENNPFITDMILGERISFDYFWYMGEDPPPYSGQSFDVLALQGGAGWQPIGQIDAYASSTGWNTALLSVPKEFWGLETQIRFVLDDYGPNTDPTVFLNNIKSSPVPEPATILLLGFGLLGLGAYSRRFRNQ